MNSIHLMPRDRARKELGQYHRIPQTPCLRFPRVDRAPSLPLVALAMLHEVPAIGRDRCPHTQLGQGRGDTATHPDIRALLPPGNRHALSHATGQMIETPGGGIGSPALSTVVEQLMFPATANAEKEVVVAVWTRVGL